MIQKFISSHQSEEHIEVETEDEFIIQEIKTVCCSLEDQNSSRQSEFGNNNWHAVSDLKLIPYKIRCIIEFMCLIVRKFIPKEFFGSTSNQRHFMINVKKVITAGISDEITLSSLLLKIDVSHCRYFEYFTVESNIDAV